MSNASRIASLLRMRHPDEYTPEGQEIIWRQAADALAAAQAALDRVRALHVESTYGGWCGADSKTWPCPTCVALDGPGE